MRGRNPIPIGLVAAVLAALAPVIAGVALLHGAATASGGGAALVDASNLRAALLNVAVAADQARAERDPSIVTTAVSAITSDRATLAADLPPGVLTGTVVRALAELDRATSALIAAAQQYATGAQSTGAGGAAYTDANHALDTLLSDLAAAIDGTSAAHTTTETRALALIVLGALLGIAGGASGWWQRRRLRATAGRLNRTLQAAALAIPDVVFHADGAGRFTTVSPAIRALLGWEPRELLGRPLADFCVLGDGPGESTDGVRMYQATWRHRDGHELTVATRIVSRDDDDADGTPLDGMVGVIQDPRPVEGAARALRESEERFRHTLDTAQNGMMIVAPDGRVILHNAALRKLVGYSNEELSGLAIGQLVPAADLDRVMALFAVRMWSDAAPSQDELRLVRRDGETLEAELSVTAFRRGGRNEGVLVEVRDVTERRRASETIRRLADYDTLTGLANRALFDRQLQIALMEARDAGRAAGVLLLDLDRFKLINDTLGHAGGDRILQTVAKRLQETLPRRYTIARFGGDEFLVLAPRLDRAEAIQHVAAQIAAALEAPVEQDGKMLRVSGSVGGAVFPEHGEDGDALVRAAGAAMYEVKERGGNGFRLFDPDHFGSASDRLTLEAELQRALERDEFRLHYQPVVDIASGRIVGAEALIRWEHPERGLLAATEFVEALEETGLIIPIGEWVLQTACEQVQRWRSQGLPDVRIAVNLSARQFLAPELDMLVRRVLQHTGLLPSQLELEVTETTAMLNMEDARRVLETLRGIGVTAAIDDFGIGHSSLARLREFPVTTLKVDRSFVMHLDGSNQDPAIVRGVVALGHALGLSVVAEGIETPEQLEILKEMGCDLGQGYLYAKPASAEEFEAMLTREDRAAA